MLGEYIVALFFDVSLVLYFIVIAVVPAVMVTTMEIANGNAPDTLFASSSCNTPCTDILSGGGLAHPKPHHFSYRPP